MDREIKNELRRGCHTGARKRHKRIREEKETEKENEKEKEKSVPNGRDASSNSPSPSSSPPHNTCPCPSPRPHNESEVAPALPRARSNLPHPRAVLSNGNEHALCDENHPKPKRRPGRTLSSIGETSNTVVPLPAPVRVAVDVAVHPSKNLKSRNNMRQGEIRITARRSDPQLPQLELGRIPLFNFKRRLLITHARSSTMKFRLHDRLSVWYESTIFSPGFMAHFCEAQEIILDGNPKRANKAQNQVLLGLVIWEEGWISNIYAELSLDVTRNDGQEGILTPRCHGWTRHYKDFEDINCRMRIRIRTTATWA
ncbi:hypothetical protein C8J57DRAFT_1219972 [Mycena rebaudengoi]|nr:hypothetical protein C8J57DRAFT_1219972 [Mycena rebaudengoi]